MHEHSGYYSLIQFCPDRSRMETVNVGLLLSCPSLGFLEARTTTHSGRAARLVGASGVERFALDYAKESIKRRVEADRETLLDPVALNRFIGSMANTLRMTAPRSVTVADPSSDLDRLFAELVDASAPKKKARSKRELFPSLESAFKKLEREGKAELDVRVNVPVLDKALAIPYAYMNGAYNLVLPQSFPRDDSSAISMAMKLAVEGDLMRNHGTHGHPHSRLIVIPKFSESQEETSRRVADLFSEYKIESVDPKRINEFVKRVEEEAHQ